VDGKLNSWVCLDLAGALGPSVLGIAQSGDTDKKDDRPRL